MSAWCNCPEEIPEIVPPACWMVRLTFGVIERSVNWKAALEITMLPMAIFGAVVKSSWLVTRAAYLLAVTGGLVAAGTFGLAGCNAVSRLMVLFVSMTTRA